VIVDVKCTVETCAAVQVDVRMKSSDPYPACTQCGAPTDRVWSVSRKGDHESANHSSVGFRFNYLAPDA
jgi:hypothetical protein